MKLLSKSETIGNILYKKLSSGKYRPGDSFPTEAQLCNEFGVSRTAVREALSGLSREGLIKRSPRKGTVVLKSSSQKTVIGFMSSLLYQQPVAGKNYFDTTHFVHFTEWMQILSLEAAKHGATLVHVPRFQNDEELVSMIRNSNISRMILFGADWLQEQKKILDKLKIVSCSIFETENKDDNYVVFDNLDGARQAASYVLAKGHRDIVILTGNQKYKGYAERVSGFMDVFAENGIARESVIVIQCADEGVNAAYNAVRECLVSGRPEVFLCCSDFMALGAMNAAVERGLSVPGDIGIMGFDGLISLDSLRPRLSTIRTPKNEIASEAIKFLAGQDKEGIHLVIKPEIVLGETL